MGPAGRIFATFLVVLVWPMATSALAANWAEADPSTNFPVGALPPACDTDPTGPVCIQASVGYLNQARASLGQPPYSLPADFTSLTPPEQALILTDSDRTLYNLPPITGLTDALSQDAAAAAASDSDPQPSTSDWYAYTSNAAWGQVNIVLAYEAWMYDDGPGSANIDCTSSSPSGCWGHRHDILWNFGSGALAMGAAAGADSSGNPGYAVLLFQGSPSYNPVYSYTWGATQPSSAIQPAPTPSSAPASDQGTPASNQATPAAAPARVAPGIESLRVRGHRVTVRFKGLGGTAARCSLTRVGGGFHRAKRCGAAVNFRHLRAGVYRLRVSSSAGALTRRVRVW